MFDHGLTVGDGVFETVKALAGAPFALTRHLARLAVSARGLGCPSRISTSSDGRARNDRRAAGPDRGPARAHHLHRRGVAARLRARDGRADARHRRRAARTAAASSAIVTVPWPRNERGALAGLKTTSYAENVVALAYAKARGGSEAICADTTGRLCEGTGSNMIWSPSVGG